MARLGIFVMWLLHFLPLPLLAPIGQGLGMTFYALGRKRRRIARINLALSFPQLAERERERLVRRHFRALGRSILERGIVWWSSRERVERVVRMEGREHFEAARDKPLILLAPHFVGLDMGGIRLTTEGRFISMYSTQKNPHFDRVLLRSRQRFHGSTLVTRQDGLRPVIKGVRSGLPFYYLPDMDLGARDAVFVPFFGVPAATVTGLPRLARLTGAAVMPCITRQLPGGQGYEVRFYPPWENYPGDDIEADTRRMNACIEELVRQMPEQYYWVHKRFKTRPPGEPGFYN